MNISRLPVLWRLPRLRFLWRLSGRRHVSARDWWRAARGRWTQAELDDAREWGRRKAAEIKAAAEVAS